MIVAAVLLADCPPDNNENGGPNNIQIDPNSLGQHFAWKCVLGDKTLFPEINKLPGGSRWSFENGYNAEKNSYFIIKAF